MSTTTKTKQVTVLPQNQEIITPLNQFEKITRAMQAASQVYQDLKQKLASAKTQNLVNYYSFQIDGVLEEIANLQQEQIRLVSAR